MKNLTKRYEQELKSNDRIMIVVLLAILLIVPLAVRFSHINFISPLLYDNEILASGAKINVFTYAKSVFLMIGAIIALIILFARLTIDQFTTINKSLYGAIAATATALVVSALTSEYKTIALFGDYMRQEGTITNLIYLLLFFIALLISYEKRQLEWFGYALYPFVIINSILTLLHFYGYNTLSLGLIQNILGATNSVKISEGSRLIATIDNVNYISGISAILVGLFLTWSIFETNKKKSIYHLVASILALGMLYGSVSQSGFVTLLIVLTMILLIIMKAENKRKSFTILGTFLLLGICLFLPMASHNEVVLKETVGIFGLDNNSAVSVIKSENKDSIVSQLDKYFNIKLPEPGISVGSGRLYIWEKTIELAKNRPILGYGMDTFAYIFPQDDPNKISGLSSDSIIVDKPHNLYLGYIIGGGIITLLGVISIILISYKYLLAWIIRAKFNSSSDGILVAMFIACTAFFLQGMFNDSIIGTSPIAWILFGVLVSSVLKKKSV